MLRVVREDATEDAAPGSILDLCQGLLQTASAVVGVLQSTTGAERKADSQLEILQLQSDQALQALTKCADRFKKAPATVQKAHALRGAVQGLHQAAMDLQRQHGNPAKPRAKAASCCGLCAAPQTAPVGASSQSALHKLDAAQEAVQKTVALIQAVDTAGNDHFTFTHWLPDVVAPTDPFYKRPVAFDTVLSYLLAERLPARILIHGPSGNGKTSLLKQLQRAVNDQDHELHSELRARFSGGLKWVECGHSLRSDAPNFATELKQKAVTLAQELVPQEDEPLAQMDLMQLAEVSRERIAHGNVLVVFDNVDDGTIFRRDWLNVLPDDPQPGDAKRGIIIVTSQFNLSSICQWHSPETISIPLSSESNTNACLDLLASLWSGRPEQEELPETLKPLARKIVRECGGSPLGIKLVAPLLEASLKEKKWREVQTALAGLGVQPTARRDSISSERRKSLSSDDKAEPPPKVLRAFELRSKALPATVRKLLPVLMLFPPSQQVPVAAVLALLSFSTPWARHECTVLLRALAKACFVELRAPRGQLLAGTVSYHALLKQYLITSSEFSPAQLPGTATVVSKLPLALVVIYASPAYQQQALQVFSKLKREQDAQVWEQPPKNRRNPFLEPFWLQLLALLSDAELGPAARVPVLGAARQLVSLLEVADALCTLFGDPRSLLAASGVFSELAWQIQDRVFLQSIAQRLEYVQAVGRIVIRLRELMVREGSVTDAEEVTVLAWALADLAEYVSESARSKLRSEPMIPALQTQYQGAAVYAYQRLQETLGIEP